MADERAMIFAFGRAKGTTASGAVGVGATVVAVVDASSYAAGDAVFVSEADDSDVESLGVVVSVDGSDITVSLGPVASKSAGAKVWAASLSAVMGSLATGAPLKERDDGIERERTLDGSLHATRVRDACEFVTLAFPEAWSADLKSLRDFLIDGNGPDSGLADFAVALWDFEVDSPTVLTVRLESGVPAFSERPHTPGVGCFSVRAQVVAEGSYPA